MNDIATIGHNSPPPPVDELREDAAKLIARKDELLASVSRAPEIVTTDEVAGKMGDLVKMIRAATKAWGEIFDPLDEARDMLRGRVAAYLATRPAGSQTRGDLGSLSGQRTNWTFEITDIAAVPDNFRVIGINLDAVKSHIKRRAKDQPPAAVPGLRFFTKNSAVVR